MDRRTFIEKSFLGAAALSGVTVYGTEPASADKIANPPVTVQQVQDHLRNMGKRWIPLDSKQTVDTIKSGDPSMQVTKIATVWMGYLDTLKKAYEAGCNLVVVHEPIYYNHHDNQPTGFALEGAKRKKKFLEETGLAVIRCHDVWDRVAEIGICDAWAKFLGFQKEINRPSNLDLTLGRPYHIAYEIEPTRAGDLAASVAAKVAAHGHKNVGFVGPQDKIVRSVAIGTGAVTRFNRMVTELKVDLTICSDDGFTFWRDGAMAIDMDYPVIIASHSSSEEAGMQRMSEHLAKVFPQVPVKHIPGKCMYQPIA